LMVEWTNKRRISNLGLHLLTTAAAVNIGLDNDYAARAVESINRRVERLGLNRRYSQIGTGAALLAEIVAPVSIIALSDLRWYTVLGADLAVKVGARVPALFSRYLRKIMEEEENAFNARREEC